MNGNALTTNWNTILSVMLGLLAGYFVISVLAGRDIPFITGEKESFIALAAVGLVACGAAGIWHSIIRFGFTNPITIVGGVLGVTATLLVILTLLGTDIPLITGQRMAILVLGIIISLKVGLKIIQNTWTA